LGDGVDRLFSPDKGGDTVRGGKRETSMLYSQGTFRKRTRKLKNPWAQGKKKKMRSGPEKGEEEPPFRLGEGENRPFKS